MRVPALGEAASQLPWLSPCAASLLALARLPPAAAWLVVRQDPGAILLVLRQAASKLKSSSSPSFSSFLLDPRILEEAARFLGSSHSSADVKKASKTADHGPGALEGFVDWRQPSLRPIYLASLKYARTAHRLAEMTGRCDPESAWITGLLLPLGWLVMSAVSPEQTAECLTDPDLPEDASAVQRRRWVLDQAALARRVLRRWTVPHWFAVAIGHLGLPVEIAKILGAEPDHFQIIQLAVNLVQAQGDGLHLITGADRDELITSLGLKAGEVVEERPGDDLSRSLAWESPKSVPFLRDLLALAAEILRLRGAPVLEHLEHERDELERALEKMRSGEAARLKAQKLQSLAEFAAGAAHEINNPLAVISGQAQYLLGHESDSSRQRSLQTIISQTQRVHQVLNDLMQFARPSQPQRQVIDVCNLVREALLSLHDCALERQVQVFWPDLDRPVHLYADPRQIRTALECLLRNAVEAAPPGGWARLRLETPATGHLNIVVEDSGTGPIAAQLDHIFDPFYSGRQAGRGRGLGLPTAWRLAREHGGDVRFDGLSGGPTRFVLSLPCHAETNGHVPPSSLSGPEPERSNGCHLPDVAL